MSSPLSSVEVTKVAKLFGEVRALSAATMKVEPGEVVAIMGSNGAGKSTLLSILALTMRPTKGEVRFNGKMVRSGVAEARSNIGLLSHQPLIYPDLTGEENLRLFAKLYGVDGPSVVERLKDKLALGDFFSDRPSRVLSRGQLQRVALARALVSSPKLLLLDEPAAGLDGAAIDRISTVLEEHRADGGIAVMVTHEPELAARVATRAVMIARGKIVADQAAPGDSAGWRNLYMDAVEGGGK